MPNRERLIYPVELTFINVRYWEKAQYLKDSKSYIYAMSQNPKLFLRQIFPLNNGYVYIKTFDERRVPFAELAERVQNLKEVDLVLGETI